MIRWNDIELAKEYRKQQLREADEWRLMHHPSPTERRSIGIHHRTLAWLGYRLLLVGIQLLKRYGETTIIIPLMETASKE